MRAQPPGPKEISAWQAAPVQRCRNQTEIARLGGSCSLIGRRGLRFCPDRELVMRFGELEVLVSVTNMFPFLSAKAFQ